MAEGRNGPGDIPTSPPSPRLVGGDGRPLRTIDVHAHEMFPEVERLTANRPERAGDADLRLRTMGEASVTYNQRVMIPDAMRHMGGKLEQRLADMDAMGVDVQLVSSSPNQYHYWAPVDLAEELVRIQNDGLLDLCARAPDRLVPLAMVALQHPALAADQLRRAMAAGFRGVEISSTVGDMELSDRRLGPFWQAAETLGALVFIHPLGCSLDERLAPAYMSNHVGQPVEHAVALSHLIFGGVLDRHEGLKIVAAHGGGYLPVHMGRADHAWTQRSDAHTCTHKPSSYLKRLHFDSLVYDPRDLAELVERAGASQVVVGTDYPFDMGHYDIHGLVAATPGLSDADRAAILGGNLARLLGL